LLLHAIVHPADIQDRDGGILLLATLFGMYPFLQTLFADAAHQGRRFDTARSRPDLAGLARCPTVKRHHVATTVIAATPASATTATASATGAAASATAAADAIRVR
jgi:hypothetical protein